MRPLIAVLFAALSLTACYDAPPRKLPDDVVPLSSLAQPYQDIVAVQTAMMRRGLFQRPATCDGFRFDGEDRAASWDEIARRIETSLGERPGTYTTIAAYDQSGGSITVRGDSYSAREAVEVRWDIEMRGVSSYCVREIAIAALQT